MKNAILLFVTSLILFSCQNSQKKIEDQIDTKSTNSTVENKSNSDVSTTSPSSPTKTTLQGIDISSYQTNINWTKVKDSQTSFVFVKATGGRTYVDPTFTKHWTDVKEAGILRGAYHFYYTKDSPTDQANFFITTVLSTSDANDLPPVIDIETAGVNTEISVKQLQQDVMTFLSIVEKAFNRKPILYTSKSFANEYFNDSSFDQYYLWLADYESERPTPPNGWASTGWTFWQNSPSAIVDGIDGKVDHDIFEGTLDEIKNL